MDTKRVLLKEPIKLQLNDFIEEVDRFNSKNSTIWKIIMIDHARNYMKIQCIESNYYEKGRALTSDISAHYSHYRTRWLTYYLTNKHPLRVLYGPK